VYDVEARRFPGSKRNVPAIASARSILVFPLPAIIRGSFPFSLPCVGINTNKSSTTMVRRYHFAKVE
jgi:hypothetical protein